jgi:hypothetical protein
MRDELFDHMKHRLSETEIPDPDKGWQMMSAMLDATTRPKNLVLRRWWYAAAACLLLGGAAWALTHEVHWGGGKARVALHQGRPAGEPGVVAPGEAAGQHPAAPAETVPSSVAVPSDGTVASGVTPPSSGAGASGGLVPSGGAATSGGLVPSGGAATSGGLVPSGSAVTSGSVVPPGGVVPSGVVAPSSSTAPAGRVASAGNPGASGLSASSGLAARTGGAAVSGSRDASGGAASGGTGSSLLTPTLPDAGTDLSAALTGKTSGASADIREPVALRVKPLTASAHGPAIARPPVGPLHPARHNRWGFEAGLGGNFPGSMRNVTVNNQSKFEPGIYPVLGAIYRISTRLSLKVGIAGPSPVAYTRTLSQKSLNVNDTSFAAYTTATSTSTQIGRLLYLDVPVSAEWAILPHLSLEAGVQFSQLLHEQVATHSDVAYAYNLSPYVYAFSVQPVAQTTVRNTDLRYLVGAAYHWRRFSAEVQYQAGMQRSATQYDDQGNTLQSHTSIAKMQIMYNLR